MSQNENTFGDETETGGAEALLESLCEELGTEEVTLRGNTLRVRPITPMLQNRVTARLGKPPLKPEPREGEREVPRARMLVYEEAMDNWRRWFRFATLFHVCGLPKRVERDGRVVAEAFDLKNPKHDAAWIGEWVDWTLWRLTAHELDALWDAADRAGLGGKSRAEIIGTAGKGDSSSAPPATETAPGAGGGSPSGAGARSSGSSSAPPSGSGGTPGPSSG